MVVTRKRKGRSAEEQGTTNQASQLPKLSNSDLPARIDEFYPTEQELNEVTTQRSRNALFSWYERLRDLHNYKNEHGDCSVPQKYAPNFALGTVRLNLGFHVPSEQNQATIIQQTSISLPFLKLKSLQWVNKQRMEKRLRDQGQKSTMSEHRMALLDEMGFQWAKQKGQASWDEKYYALRDFFEKHGHCNVPTKYRDNSALGRWMSTQRFQWKEWKRGEKTSMTQERYEKLCALNFQFNCTKKGATPADNDPAGNVDVAAEGEETKIPAQEPAQSSGDSDPKETSVVAV